jgi:hypothetical protein
MVLMSFVGGRSTAGSAVNGFPYIPLTGFEPSHHLARRTFDDFCLSDLPFRGIERLTETAGYSRKGSAAWQPLAST